MPTLPEPYISYGAPSDTPGHGWSSIVGIVTAIVGNILISFALNTQRYAHIRIDREYKGRQNPAAKKARKHLPKALCNYGTAVQQEEIAEQRQRINENAEIPHDLNGHVEEDHERELRANGTRRDSQETLRGHHEVDDEEKGDNGKKSYLKSPWWWLGIVLMTVGEAGNFLAYGFAPASIVSPLGVVALISNCLIAPLMLKEHFRQRDLWGVVIAIAGAVTVVLSAKTSEKKLGPHALWDDIRRWEFLTYLIITVVFITALSLASPKYGQRTVLVDLGLVGLFGGYTVLSTKGVASLLSTSLYRAFEYPIFYVLILILVLSAVMQIRYLNRALQNFDSTQVIPVQFVLFTLSVIIGSAVLYRDFERTDSDHALKFVFGCLLTFGGVYLITSGRKQDDEDDHVDTTEHDAEQIRLLDEEREEEAVPPTKREPALKLETNGAVPDTPRPPLSGSPPATPFIAVTPAASTDDLNKNPWISSTDHLARLEDEASAPQTPRNQSLPAASSSQTPFFTPHTPSRGRVERTASASAQPETPTRRAPSLLKPSIEDLSTTKRTSISRLLPGPILQPLSGSLSGIVADRILKGERGLSPSPTSRHQRWSRESTRPRMTAPHASDTDLESGQSSAFASDSSVNGAKSARQARAAVGGEDSPLLKRTASHDVGYVLGGSLRNTKGRLRSMSETLTSFITGTRGSKDDEDATGDQQPS